MKVNIITGLRNFFGKKPIPKSEVSIKKILDENPECDVIEMSIKNDKATVTPIKSNKP